MNALAQTFVIAFGSVAAAAVIGVGLANHAADAADTAPSANLPATPRHLSDAAPSAPSAPPVTVVARLPRVVIEHRRTGTGPTTEPVTIARAAVPPAL